MSSATEVMRKYVEERMEKRQREKDEAPSVKDKLLETIKAKEPRSGNCSSRMASDFLSAFSMGLFGGAALHFLKTMYYAPPETPNKVMYALRRALFQAPKMGLSFGMWGGLFSLFDCGLTHIRDKEDSLNAIASGAITGGILAFRQGPAAAGRGALIGGILLGVIEGFVGLIGLMTGEDDKKHKKDKGADGIEEPEHDEGLFETKIEAISDLEFFEAVYMYQEMERIADEEENEIMDEIVFATDKHGNNQEVLSARRHQRSRALAEAMADGSPRARALMQQHTLAHGGAKLTRFGAATGVVDSVSVQRSAESVAAEAGRALEMAEAERQQDKAEEDYGATVESREHMRELAEQALEVRRMQARRDRALRASERELSALGTAKNKTTDFTQHQKWW